MPVILATQEAEFRKIMVQSQPRQKKKILQKKKKMDCQSGSKCRP
jgi:hypothetical protein